MVNVAFGEYQVAMSELLPRHTPYLDRIPSVHITRIFFKSK